MGMWHTVQQGEYLSKIALQHGFSDFGTIWDHAQNSELKKTRSNPSILYPGDRVFIPVKEPKETSAATNKKHRFEAKRPELALRIVLRDLNGEPLANTECQLQIDGETHDLTTSGDGKIEHPLPMNAGQGRLRFRDVELPLKIGHLDPVDELSGWRERLNNLGYNAGTSEDSESRQLRYAVEEFQCEHCLTVDGRCGPKTQAKLIEVYGC